MTTAAESIAAGKQARAEHRLDVARAYYAEAAEIYSTANDRLAYAHTIRHIADMYRIEGRYAEARPIYEGALEIYRTSLNTKLLDLANTVCPYALLLESTGNHEAAHPLFQEARNLYASLRLEAAVTECDKHLADRS
jgi:tetratricopeptide (TPR) repeat protein